MLSTLVLSAALATVPPPTDPPEPTVAQLQAQVAQLEAKVVLLEERLSALESRGAAPAAPGAAEEAAAQDAYRQLTEAYEQGDVDEAKKVLALIKSQYPGTRAERMADRIGRELAVIGKKVPENWEQHIEEWYTKQRRFDLEKGVVVALFWESWCPHCRREVPKWQATSQQYAGQGLQVVGFTKLTRSSTREKAVEFVADHKLTFPMAKEDGALSGAVDVSGIPAAAVYRDGVVIWRGHPARITDQMLQEWLLNQ